MLQRVLVLVWLGTSLPAGAAFGAPQADAPAARMSVSAGLAGVGRLGRWMPVDVDVDNSGEDIDGTLVLAWGTARVERLVSIPAPSRRMFHLFIRTGDVRDVVTATLRSRNREPITVSAPVRVVGNDEKFTLCAAGMVASADACAAALPAAALPATWRDYDTADEVLVPETAQLSADQRDALLLWRAERTAEQRGGTPRPVMTATEDSAWTEMRALLGVYTLAIVAIALPGWRSRRFAAIGVVACLSVAVSIAAAVHHRASPVVIRHSTALHQYAGAPAAFVDVAAVADFASDGAYAVTASLESAAMNVGRAYGAPAPQRFDADGYPLLAGTFGLGARQPFQLEATAPAILEVSEQGTRVRITNVSPLELRDCELPAAFTPRSVALLETRQTFEATGSATADDPVLRCTATGSPVTFADTNHPVATIGTTTVTYDFVREGEAE